MTSDKRKLSFLIIDDHVIVRKGLSYLLKGQYHGIAVDIADEEKNMLSLIKRKNYDLVILDLNLPDFEPLALLPNLFIIAPNIKVLVYSMYSENLFAKRVLNLGAKGYLEKGAPEKELFQAINTIMNGGIYVSNKMTNLLLGGGTKNQPLNIFDSLSDREFEVLLLIIRGRSPQEITKILNVHSSTVGTYKTRVFQKLKVKTLVDLLQLARNYGIT